MGQVKLRVNMIIDGHGFPFGTLIDEEKIPIDYRKRRYIVRPGEKDMDELRFRAQASVAENQVDPSEINLEMEVPQTEEEVIRHHIANKRAMRRG